MVKYRRVNEEKDTRAYDGSDANLYRHEAKKKCNGVTFNDTLHLSGEGGDSAEGDGSGERNRDGGSEGSRHASGNGKIVRAFVDDDFEEEYVKRSEVERFQLTEKIGEGTFGEVYTATALHETSGKCSYICI